jgi:DNA end-binding protein Ku
MPQAVWTGTISFGLVSVPVRLYPATRRKDVRFHEIDRESGQRVRHQRVAPREEPIELAPEPTWRPDLTVRRVAERNEAPAPSRQASPQPAQSIVPAAEIVRGFEVAPNRYVTVGQEELAELAPEQTRTIDIEQFVDSSSVDPIYFDRSYYAVPERDHARPYALLTQAMRETKKLAISWFVLRRKRYLAAVRAEGNLMVLTTLFFADEIVPRESLEPRPVADLTKREREMAKLLLDTLSGPFEPERYPDDYRQRVQALIEGRAETALKTPTTPLASRSTGVNELMAALQASVNEARAQRKRKAPPAARRKKKSA